MRIKPALALHRARRLAGAGRAADAVTHLKETYATCADPRLLIQTVRLSGAKDDREALVSNHSGNAAAMLTAAISALAAHDYDGAALAATKGLSARPDDPSLRASLAIARSRAGAEPLNMAELHQSAKNAVPDVKALVLAEVELEIIKLAPSDRGAAEKDEALGGPVGFVLDRLDDLAAVMGWVLSGLLNFISNAMNAKRRAVYRHIAAGDRLYSMRRRDEAAERFEEALRIDPECVEALESLSRHHLQTGDVVKASARFAALEKTLAAKGEAAPHLSRLRADIAFFTGGFKEALDLYVEAAQTAPHDHMAHYRRGLCFLRMGDEKGAAESFRKALSMPNAGLMEERFVALEVIPPRG